MNPYLKYSSLALTMGATIGLLTYIGYRLDRHFATAHPYFTIALSLIGVAAALYQAVRDFIVPKK